MDIFKQAIAEAKAVREAAISNARDAMEESLTPHLKNMLAAKLQEMEELENENLVHEAEEEEVEDTEDAEVEDSEDEEPAEDDAEESEDEAEEEELDVDEMELEDLKNLIRDIVAQEMEAGDAGMGDFEDEEGGVEDMIDTDMDAEVEPGMGPDTEAEMGPEDEGEEINLDELIAELEGLEEEEEEEVHEAKEGKKAEKAKVQKMKGGTDEKMKSVTAGKKHFNESKELLRKAYDTINTLRNDLSEVNLLNSKLLYVSKILKAHNLNESQKVNLIATFDKAETIKEVKLVYETVSENINQASRKKQTNRQSLKEHKSFASKPAGQSTRGNIISEGNEQVLRMQKLAGIIK